MVNFHKYETTDLALKFTPSGVLEDYSKIIVSIVQNGVARVDKTENDLTIDGDNITIHLSQEETGKFMANSTAEVQVNILYEDSERDVSTTGTIEVLNNLYNEVMDSE